MMTKTAYYMQMAQEAAAQITGSKEQWTAFLTTSARLYKYPFAEQLMISIQQKKAKSSVIIRLRRFLQKAEHQSRKRRH